MTCTGSQGAVCRLNSGHLGMSCYKSRFARRVISALPVLPFSLCIALAGVSGSGALASGCSDWEGDETKAFWATATVETIAPCLADAQFAERGRGDASKPLVMAARYSSDPAVAEALIVAGARMGPDEPESGKFDIALHEAAKHNKNTAIVGVLLEHGLRFLNSHDGGGGAPLHYAAGSRNIGAAKALIVAGADVNLEERWFAATPLQYAAKRDDNTDMIALLVSAGADVNKVDCDGDTPLHDAAKYAGTTTTLEALLKAGADANARNRSGPRHSCKFPSGAPRGATPLHFAVRHNENVAVTEALIAVGADPNMTGGNLLATPLHYAAAYNGNPAVISALADAGADVNARVSPTDKSDGEVTLLRGYVVNHMTPLHLAAMVTSNPGVVDALLSSGAAVDAKSSNDTTPLHLAAMATSEAVVVSALVAAGADVEARDAKGLTPLHYAMEKNDNPDVAAALVRRGADVNARSTDFPAATLLHKVARYGKDPSIVSMLVAAGADVNAKDIVKATPLHYAATFNDNPDIVVALVDTGADVNARMRSRHDLEKGRSIGETPLHRAVRYNDEASVTKALLDAGANPRALDEHGDTPLDLTRYSSDEVRDLLEGWARDHADETSGVLPAGTRLVIPRRVLEDFEQKKHKWSQVRTYLMANFHVSGPSLLDEGKDTFYVPLARQNGPNKETILVDILNFRSIDIGNKKLFVTERETVALEVTNSIRDYMRNSAPTESPHQP